MTIPTRIGEYELLGLLGRGGQGSTYLAEDDAGHRVALKEFRGARAVETRRREAEALDAIDHPAVPHLVSTFEDTVDGEQRFYVAQQYVEGTSLQQAIDDGQRFSEADVRRILKELLAVLDALHHGNPPVVHRDIKPANLIRRPDGSVAIVDFGGGISLDDQEVLGTVGYAAPEQYFGEASPASDYYSLGATLLHMLTHRHPADFPAVRLRPQLEGYIDCSDGMRRLIEALLDPDPANRPTSPDEVMCLLDASGEDIQEKNFTIRRRNDLLEIHATRKLKLRDAAMLVFDIVLIVYFAWMGSALSILWILALTLALWRRLSLIGSCDLRLTPTSLVYHARGNDIALDALPPGLCAKGEVVLDLYCYDGRLIANALPQLTLSQKRRAAAAVSAFLRDYAIGETTFEFTDTADSSRATSATAASVEQAQVSS